MFRRLVVTGLVLLWINLNYTLLTALIFIGWARLGNEDSTLGWWMIAAGEISMTLYFVFLAAETTKGVRVLGDNLAT